MTAREDTAFNSYGEVEQLARDAGDLLLHHFRSAELQTKAKGELDVVTQADTEAERLIATRLGELFPDDAVVGEEGTATDSANGRQWFIDPLDGTYNFSRGLPFWCVSIGLVEHGESEYGIVFDPLHQELFSAERGLGARLNGAPIAASAVRDPMEATVQLTLNYDRSVIEMSIQDFNVVARN